MNHNDYQCLVDGKPVTVSSLTMRQAKDELCDLMDLVDKLESRMLEMQAALTNWRTGQGDGK